MKRLKKFFLVFLIGVVSVVLTFGTFSVASADTLSYDDNKAWLEFYEPIGPAEGYTYYVVFEFDTSYKVIYLHKDTIGLANSQGVLPVFVYSSLLGTQHYLTLSIVGGYNAYVYDVPKSFLDSGGLFSDFTSLNYHILKCDWELPTVSEFVDSSISSSVKLTYSFNGPEIVYVSTPGLFYWSFPPVVAGNFSFEIPSAFIVNQAFQSKVDGTELYDVFREQAAYEGGYLSFDSGASYDKGYDAGYDAGFDKGYDSGVSTSESGIFGSMKVLDFSFTSAPYTLSEDMLTLDFLRYGVSFNTISRNALEVLTQNSWGGSFEFTLTLSFDLPFTFYNEMIFVKDVSSFLTLTFYNLFGTAYQVSVSDVFNEQRGYPLIYSSELDTGQTINKLVITMEAGSSSQFSSPFNAIYQSGYVKGNNEGLIVGYDNGYGVGWDEGFTEGKNIAYNEYAAESTGWNVISGAFSSILSVMDVNVFGYFSIGDVLGLVLVFGVVFFVFKLIRG